MQDRDSDRERFDDVETATPRELVRRLSTESQASSKSEQGRARTAEVSKLIRALRRDEGVCANRANYDVHWDMDIALNDFSGRAAVVLQPGTVFSVDEEGRWSSSFSFGLHPFCTQASFVLRFTFLSQCGTHLLTLGDAWTFKGGLLPIRTAELWSDPYNRSRGAEARIDRRGEFFPLVQSNIQGQAIAEVRSGVSPGLRRDFRWLVDESGAEVGQCLLSLDGLFHIQLGDL